MSAGDQLSGVAVVVIGRNEGERLRRCLDSVVTLASCVVYVDSGSTDGSVKLAQSMGIKVVDLDMSTPFTAARARNEGVKQIGNEPENVQFVQFVDGDCELEAGWLQAAHSFIAGMSDVAMVCGRLRERFPERSIYNLLCDIEWDTPVGNAKACGGIAMVRLDAFNAAGGFRELIAGEEPELCVRLRRAGWKIWRLDRDMGWHDAAMTRFGQWWKRMVRGGHAYAEGASLHGALPERLWVRESRRAWFWGFMIPLGIICAMIGWGWGGAGLWMVYPAQVLRLALKGGRTPRENWLQAFFLVLGKFPEVLGQLKYLLRKIGAGKAALIEYK